VDGVQEVNGRGGYIGNIVHCGLVILETISFFAVTVDRK